MALAARRLGKRGDVERRAREEAAAAVSGSVVSSTYLTMSRMIMTLLEEEKKKLCAERLSEITLSPQLLFSSLLSNDPFPQGS